jgi:isopenicillin-N N-acyltransferase-like protein
MGLPEVRLRGTPYEQGVIHGRALREAVAHNLAVYFHRFQHEAGLEPRAVLARAERCLAALPAQNAEYAEALRGLADGSGAGLLELAALNVRYEILYHQYTVNAMADGCTAFAVAPAATADGHLLMGQNWDWIPQVRGAVLRIEDPSGLQLLCFTEAGIAGGKIGLNSAGIGLAINGMTTTADDWQRMGTPFHVRCWEILRSRDLGEAKAVVRAGPRSCSANYLIAQTPDQVVDLEAAPTAVRELGWTQGCLVHANHFVEPEALGVAEPPNPRRGLSCRREARLGALLRGRPALTVADLQAFLRDHDGHPNSVCRHPDPELSPDQHSITVAAAVMDLNAGVLYLTDRQPCGNPFEAFWLGEEEAEVRTERSA